MIVVHSYSIQTLYLTKKFTLYHKYTMLCILPQGKVGKNQISNKGDACKTRQDFEVVIGLLIKPSSSQTVLQDKDGD